MKASKHVTTKERSFSRKVWSDVLSSVLKNGAGSVLAVAR